MSKQIKSKSKKPDGRSSAARITDARFASFETDPRYALPSKRRAKTTIDKRFSRMLKDDEFTATAKTDRYGRKVKSDSKKKALQRLYQEEEEEEDDDDDEDKEDGSDVEVDDDDIVQRELEKANSKYDPARGGGFSSSEDDSDSGSDDDDDDESDEEQVDNAPDMQQYRTQQAEVETGDVTNRIAIVNLDWDNIKSVDLMALCNSFVPIGGRIEKVSIYPSEFGKERMQREELEGPPKEIFKKSAEDGGDESDSHVSEKDDGEDSDEEAKNELLKEENDEDFDSDALRTYQLDRLRYYYAVMICSDIKTAQKIYEATDGSEYLSSSNFLDLRFIPDDVTFDDEPRDECTKVPNNYKPVEFVTDALQHSKVKLTWDMHPEEASRKETMKNAFSGSRDGIAENDIKAYLASGSEDEDDEDQDDAFGAPGAGDDGPKLSKKALARRKLREALGLKDEPSGKSSKSDGPVGDMQITFTSALTGPSDKKAPEEETTAEKYIRKERERKAKRKEKALANRQVDKAGAGADQEEPQEDLGFNDPFFTAEEPEQKSKSAMHKEERLKKRAAREAEEKQHAEEKAQLQLLMTDNLDEEAGHLDHFDMNEILKAEKNKKKKGKKGKKSAEEAAGLQDDFQMDVEGDRFKAVFEDHEFAIDPSNPKFKATSGMKKLLEEGRKKRKYGGDEDVAERRRDNKPKKAKAGGGSELSNLVSSIKKKSGRR